MWNCDFAEFGYCNWNKTNYLPINETPPTNTLSLRIRASFHHELAVMTQYSGSWIGLPSVRPQALFAAGCPIYFVLTVSSTAARAASIPLTSSRPMAAVLPCNKIWLPPKVLFVQQNENTVSTQIKLGDVQDDGPNNAWFTCSGAEVKISVSSSSLL